MAEKYPNIPWFKFFCSGFLQALKWLGLSLLVGIPGMIGMFDEIDSMDKFFQMMWRFFLFIVAFATLLAFLCMILIAYYRFYWMRVFVLTSFILFFAVQILLLIFIPYVGIWGFIVAPPDLPLWGLVIVIGLYAAFLYWWSKIPYGLFIKFNVIKSLAGWVKKTAGEETANRKKLEEAIAEGLSGPRKKRRQQRKKKRKEKRAKKREQKKQAAGNN